MPGLSRIGDKNIAGGRILKGAKTVFANSKPVGLHPSPLTPHPPSSDPRHKKAFTLTGSPTVFCEGQPVLRIGSKNTCGHVIIQGSLTIFVP